MDIPLLLVLFLSGVVGVLWGIGRAVFSKTATNGIWFTGIGVVLTVLALLLCAGYIIRLITRPQPIYKVR